MDKFLDVQAVANILGLSPVTIRKYIGKGALKVVRLGRRVLIEPDELERFHRAGKATSVG
jgi:excisionase family DNA binding protein